MKLWLIKTLIKWLAENHYYLVFESVIPPGYHKHKDPERKVKEQDEPPCMP
jgi:hypothetical protein